MQKNLEMICKERCADIQEKLIDLTIFSLICSMSEVDCLLQVTLLHRETFKILETVGSL